MATTRLQPAAAPANAPVHQPSRRSMLSILAVGPLAMLPPLAAMKCSAAEAASPTEWNAACRAYREAVAIHEEACGKHSDAEERYFAVLPKVPTFTMEVEGDYGRFGKHTLPITIYAEDLDDPTRKWADPARMEEMRAQLAKYRKADAEARARFNLDALEAECTAALDAASVALDRVIDTPAPDAAALIEKIAIIMKEFDDGSENHNIGAVLADVRRLAREA